MLTNNAHTGYRAYLKIRDGLYLRLSHPDQPKPLNYMSTMNEGYFYEVERKRCKKAGIKIRVVDKVEDLS